MTKSFAIVQNLERLFDLVGGGGGEGGLSSVDHGTTKTTCSSDKAIKQSFQKQDKTVTSFRYYYGWLLARDRTGGLANGGPA